MGGYGRLNYNDDTNTEEIWVVLHPNFTNAQRIYIIAISLLSINTAIYQLYTQIIHKFQTLAQ